MLIAGGCRAGLGLRRVLSRGALRRAYSLSSFDAADMSQQSAKYGPQKSDKIKIAMSGGVDSSVTALLLAQSDRYELEAVFMRNWNELDETGSLQPGSGGAMGCSWQQDWDDVQAVCRHLGGIPASMIDLSKEYWTNVFEPALGDWEQGTTPNPDVDCNREIKFGALMDRLVDTHTGSPASSDSTSSSGTGKTWLATGHYAEIGWSDTASIQDGGAPRPVLLRAADRTKDQSYYLSSVLESRLAHAHFPLAPYLKSEVRALAVKHALPTAARKESMGICFIGNRGRGPNNGFSRFLGNYLSSTPGNIVDECGNKVGEHRGMHSVTVGQGARISGALAKYYVARKDIPKNEIVVVQGKTHPMLMCTRLHVPRLDWIWSEAPREATTSHGVRLLAQVRHRMKEVECIVRPAGPDRGGFVVEFPDPVLAVAPGQVLGLWKDKWCLGSGTIGHVTTLYDQHQHQQ
ncbi:5-methylaminomethyl-2-thiouridylate-methyltransferase [Testicularia cyperi]|uniref:tRNA-5-taurinomethyluridine 2-sulfurtransferase n=1 Tax=Testicularia cyperi TaxID=1882483 RepID=A0A317XWP2_9BASI|nr:5-methylaminomethyl-2-thiouridylate-methyltransferase [Testicularia cyperi]